MRLTVTGANSRLGRAAIVALAESHTVRAVDTATDMPLPVGVASAIGDLRNREFAARVTSDTDAVLHLAPVGSTSNGSSTSDMVDTFSRGSYNLVDMAMEQGVSRILLGSTLAMFDRLPTEWRVDESWRPRPQSREIDLACWLSELSLRESCHTAPVRAICLRFGNIVTEAETADKPFDPTWLAIEDAVRAVLCGVRLLEETPTWHEWEIFHISCGDRAKISCDRARGERFGYTPRQTFADRPSPLASDPPCAGSNWRTLIGLPRARPLQRSAGKRRVVIFGSAGPVASSLARELANDYIVRQTDVRPLREVIDENKPQSEGAPMPVLLDAPHEERVVDVRDYDQVRAACDGMDLAVNCSVVRPDPVEAFRVNTVGAYNVMRAAKEAGIRRVVQTGPQQMTMDSRTGYWWEYAVPGNAPARPGRQLYAHSKFLGQEICRLFAENFGIETPVLVYAQFLNPQVTRQTWTMSVSWEDSARALRAALEVNSLPSPYEEMVITSDLPAGKFSATRATEVLGWEARDDLSKLWAR